jgi:RNA polymerase sigma-70 factor (ECF subfamily)
LSELEREVFMLRHFGEVSFQEIARMLDININTALSRMHQAMSRLKELAGEAR